MIVRHKWTEYVNMDNSKTVKHHIVWSSSVVGVFIRG